MGHRASLAARIGSAVDGVYGMMVAARPGWPLYSAVAMTVAIFVFVVLGWGYISGTGAYWQQPLYDAGAHVSGWLFFSHDAWHVPIFDTVRMNYPDGGSIVLTDSIPLVALVAKVFGLGLAGSWQYFGLFVAGAYVLNALALLWLLRQMDFKNIVAGLVAVTFACFTTLYNIQFESFFAQFIVILSLGLYVRVQRRVTARELGWFVALVAASLLIHPYLFAMSLGIFVVTLVTIWRRRQTSLRLCALWLGGAALLIGAIAWAAGYTAHPATGYQEQLYGTSPMFALDPAALFQKSYSVDEIGLYLGAGFWVLALAGLVVLWRCYRTMIASHVWLIVLCVLFVLVAASNTLFVQGHEVFHLNLPHIVASVTEMFRASKRFIVPVYYLTVAASTVLLLRQRSRWGLTILLVALVLQVADVSFFVRDMHQSARQGQPAVIDQKEWSATISKVSIVQVFPSYSCLFNYRTAPLSGQWTASLELYQLAAREGKISNSVRASRRTKDCDKEAQQSQQHLSSANLSVYLVDDAQHFMVQPSRECTEQHHRFQYGIYCIEQ